MQLNWNQYVKDTLAPALTHFAKFGGALPGPFVRYGLSVGDADPAACALRVEEVHGAWQRNRQHVKYGALITALIVDHGRASALVLDPAARRDARQEQRAAEERRFATVDELLRAAEAQRGYLRVVELEQIALATNAGFDVEDVRLRARLPIVQPLSALISRTIEPDRYKAIKLQLATLQEPNLYTFLTLPYGASSAQRTTAVAACTDRWQAARADERKSAAERLLQQAGTLDDAMNGSLSSYDGSMLQELKQAMTAKLHFLPNASSRRISPEEISSMAREAVGQRIPLELAQLLTYGLLAEHDFCIAHAERSSGRSSSPGPEQARPTPIVFEGRLRPVGEFVTWVRHLIDTDPRQALGVGCVLLIVAPLALQLLTAVFGGVLAFVPSILIAAVLLTVSYQGATFLVCSRVLRSVTSTGTLETYVQRDGTELVAYRDQPVPMQQFLNTHDVTSSAFVIAVGTTFALLLAPAAFSAARYGTLPQAGSVFAPVLELGIASVLFKLKLKSRIDHQWLLSRAVRLRFKALKRASA